MFAPTLRGVITYDDTDMLARRYLCTVWYLIRLFIIRHCVSADRCVMRLAVSVITCAPTGASCDSSVSVITCAPRGPSCDSSVSFGISHLRVISVLLDGYFVCAYGLSAVFLNWDVTTFYPAFCQRLSLNSRSSLEGCR